MRSGNSSEEELLEREVKTAVMHQYAILQFQSTGL